jgi:predicted transcriptional regulator
MQDNLNEFEKLLETTGLKVSEFIRKYDIPERTVMNWKQGGNINAVTSALFKTILENHSLLNKKKKVVKECSNQRLYEYSEKKKNRGK